MWPDKLQNILHVMTAAAVLLFWCSRVWISEARNCVEITPPVNLSMRVTPLYSAEPCSIISSLILRSSCNCLLRRSFSEWVSGSLPGHHNCRGRGPWWWRCLVHLFARRGRFFMFSSLIDSFFQGEHEFVQHQSWTLGLLALQIMCTIKFCEGLRSLPSCQTGHR